MVNSAKPICFLFFGKLSFFKIDNKILWYNFKKRHDLMPLMMIRAVKSCFILILSSAVIFPIDRRTDSQMLFKHLAKILIIYKTGLLRNLFDRLRSRNQMLTYPVQPKGKQVFGKSHSHLLLKQCAEIRRSQSNMTCRMSQSNLL